VAVMSQGRIEQVGTPLEIFERPETAFVATFTGAANLWDAEVLGAAGEGRLRVRLATGLELEVPAPLPAAAPGAALLLALRPERLTLRAGSASPAAGADLDGMAALPVTVEESVYQGARTVWLVRDAAGERRVVHQSTAAGPAHGVPATGLQPGSPALLCWDPRHCVLLRR
ncbi:MAG TPA: TOBE domain-containing protein, partial [Thermoanaerobaculia bacterium]|nr:TOBE domain-containing protein [Thermoanaerobaculia bacterium]